MCASVWPCPGPCVCGISARGPALAAAELPESTPELLFSGISTPHFKGSLLEDGVPVRLGLTAGPRNRFPPPTPAAAPTPSLHPILESVCCLGASNKRVFPTLPALGVTACGCSSGSPPPSRVLVWGGLPAGRPHPEVHGRERALPSSQLAALQAEKGTSTPRPPLLPVLGEAGPCGKFILGQDRSGQVRTGSREGGQSASGRKAAPSRGRNGSGQGR